MIKAKKKNISIKLTIALAPEYNLLFNEYIQHFTYTVDINRIYLYLFTYCISFFLSFFPLYYFLKIFGKCFAFFYLSIRYISNRFYIFIHHCLRQSYDSFVFSKRTPIEQLRDHSCI